MGFMPGPPPGKFVLLMSGPRVEVEAGRWFWPFWNHAPPRNGERFGLLILMTDDDSAGTALPLS